MCNTNNCTQIINEEPNYEDLHRCLDLPTSELLLIIINVQGNTYGRTPMPNCHLNKVAKQLYWNYTLAWVFSCNFVAYFLNTFYSEHIWTAASVLCTCGIALWLLWKCSQKNEVGFTSNHRMCTTYAKCTSNNTQNISEWLLLFFAPVILLYNYCGSVPKKMK